MQGKNILVCAETGYGNIIQFSRYLSILKQYGCNIIFSCPDDLHHLFYGQDYIDKIISTNEFFDDYEYWIALQSLIPLLTPDPSESCPMPTMLNVNDNKLIEWETLLGVDNKIKIGICWQGSNKNARDHLNSIDLSLFKDILKIENTSFISLQKGHGHHQIAKYNFSKHIVDYDMLMDSGSQKFIDTTAIIKYLDLVITTDTSIAHLAGSLGTQTWVLLPKLCDWRWFEDTDETIWYENMRLFRQEKSGDWENLLKKVHDETLNLSKNLYEIRKEQEIPVGTEEENIEKQASTITEDIELENIDENITATSAEDIHNENIDPSLQENKMDTAAEQYDNDANNNSFTNENFDQNKSFGEDAEEHSQINNLNENANDENIEEVSALDSEQENQDTSDNNEIVPRVIRDDDGGEKIKFKR